MQVTQISVETLQFEILKYDDVKLHGVLKMTLPLTLNGVLIRKPDRRDGV